MIDLFNYTEYYSIIVIIQYVHYISFCTFSFGYLSCKSFFDIRLLVTSLAS